MPGNFPRTIPPLTLTPEDQAQLAGVLRSRQETVQRVTRARVLRDYAAGDSIPTLVQRYGATAHPIGRCVNKALAFGPRVALDDWRRAGRPPRITPEARAGIIRLACQKPKDLGWAPACWSEALLARYGREHAAAAGHPRAGQVQQGTIAQRLAAQDLHPHRIPYYLQRNDPDFDRKMAPGLHTYQQVTLDLDPADGRATVRWSDDEKPGRQALAGGAPDRPPLPDVEGQATWPRDDEYKRLGTRTLLAGPDLATGEVLGLVRPRHRRREFLAFLEALDAKYGQAVKIQAVLDHHAAHTAPGTRAYLATKPNRFASAGCNTSPG